MEYLIGKASGDRQVWTAAPHPIVLAAVQANVGGLDVRELKLQLDELFAHAGRTIKTFRLSQYLQAFPTQFRCEGDQAHTLQVIAQESHSDMSIDAFPPLLPAPPLGGRLLSEAASSRTAPGSDTVPLPAEAPVPEPQHDNAIAHDHSRVHTTSDYDTLVASNQQLRARVQDLEAQLEVMEAKEEMHLCHICMDASQDIVLMPCLHATFCSTCIEAGAKGASGGNTPVYSMSKCPTCRTTIHGVLKLRLGV